MLSPLPLRCAQKRAGRSPPSKRIKLRPRRPGKHMNEGQLSGSAWVARTDRNGREANFHALPANICFPSRCRRRSEQRAKGCRFRATNAVGLRHCAATPGRMFAVHVVGYMRISTADERQSVDLQRDALLARRGRRAAPARGSCVRRARDVRPGLKACLADLRRGDVLVVWKFDQLGRSLSHLIRIVEQLKTREVAFRSLTEATDTTTPHAGQTHEIRTINAQGVVSGEK